MAGSRFRYNPLAARNDIRLLQIHASDSKHVNAYRLVTKSLDSDPVYVALSYTWGDPGEKCEITCNGCRVEITKNLHSALHRLRLPISAQTSAGPPSSSRLGRALNWLRSRPPKSHSRMILNGQPIDPTGDVSDVMAHFLPGPLYLWADAICIDQSNADEKAVQVGMMHRIYRQASLVVADLGQLSENTKYALQTMPGFADPLKVQVNQMKDADVSIAREKILAGFRELFLQPWFSRVWVFQEVVLAKETAVLWDNNLSLAMVLYGTGKAIMGLDADMQYGPNLFEEYETAKDIAARAYVNFEKMVFWNHMRSVGFRPKMLDILQTQMISGATDGRDKIYAYLGLAEEFVDRPFKVDYSESTSQTYYRFACHMLVQEKELRLLHLVTGQDKRLGLPSWVPDFSARSIVQPIGFGRQTEHAVETEIIYQAGGTQDPVFQVLTQFRELRIRGMFQDTIAHVGRAWRTSQSLNNPTWIDLVLVFVAAEALDMTQRYCVGSAGKGMVDACLRTLVCNTADGVKRLDPKTHRQMQNGFDRLRAACLDTMLAYRKKHVMGWDDTNDNTEFELSDDSRKITRRFLEALSVISADRRFAITKTGRPAFEPAAAEAGDHICILQGMPTPFVIRGHKAGHDLIGEAYVHGIMEGEALSLTSQLGYITLH